MSSAVFGLLGAIIGAFAGFAGVIVANLFQARLEHRRWLRAKREEAYSNSIRFLLRMKGKRSTPTEPGESLISQKDRKDWFDELSEIRQWMTTLVIYCSDDYRDRIELEERNLSKVIDDFIMKDSIGDADMPGLEYHKLPEIIASALTVVMSCARSDLRKAITEDTLSSVGALFRA